MVNRSARMHLIGINDCDPQAIVNAAVIAVDTAVTKMLQ